MALQAPTDPARWGSAATTLDLHAALADAAASTGDLETVSRYAPLAEREARRIGHRLHLGIAQRARGQAAALRGAYAEAESMFDEALSLFETLGARWQTGRTLLARSALRAAMRREAEARADRLRAESIFVSIGAAPDAAEARLSA